MHPHNGVGLSVMAIGFTITVHTCIVLVFLVVLAIGLYCARHYARFRHKEVRTLILTRQ